MYSYSSAAEDAGEKDKLEGIIAKRWSSTPLDAIVWEQVFWVFPNLFIK
jgi:hypothetical protein